MTLEAGQARILRMAEMILQAAKNRVEASDIHYRDVEWRLEEIRLVVGYAEPGYGCTDSIIAFGNWNPVDLVEPVEGGFERTSGFQLPARHINKLPEKLGEMFEEAGVEIEWSDEWTECSGCYKAVRTKADSFSWTPSYVMGDGELHCEDCVLEDPSSYLEGLEGDENNAITLSVDPTQHGYTQLPERYEAGWHRGQDASPALIAAALREADIHRFVFSIDSQGQFDMRFSVYVANEELAEFARDAQQEHYETCNNADFCGHGSPTPDDVEDDGFATTWGERLLVAKLSNTETDGPSRSEGLKRALQSIPTGSAPAGGILYSKIDAEAGTSETHVVSREDFENGDLP